MRGSYFKLGEKVKGGLFFGTWETDVKAETKDVRSQTSGLERREYVQRP